MRLLPRRDAAVRDDVHRDVLNSLLAKMCCDTGWGITGLLYDVDDSAEGLQHCDPGIKLAKNLSPSPKASGLRHKL